MESVLEMDMVDQINKALDRYLDHSCYKTRFCSAYGGSTMKLAFARNKNLKGLIDSKPRCKDAAL